MYLPAAFADHDPARCRALIETHPLATVIVNGVDGAPPEAQHVPLLCLPRVDAAPDPETVDAAAGRYRLLGHVARANPLARARPGIPVLVVFQGPGHPISPAWYATKATDPRVVPTWNYATVHVTGRLAVFDDAPRTLDALNRLTDVTEARLGSAWRLADAPADHVARLLQAIVAIEIVVDACQGKWKLSQNRPAADRASVVAALDARATERADPAALAMARLVAAQGQDQPV